MRIAVSVNAPFASDPEPLLNVVSVTTVVDVRFTDTT